MVYLHLHLVLSWINSLLASLRTSFPSCHSQILLLNSLPVDLAILPSFCLKEQPILFSYLVLMFFSSHAKFGVVNAFIDLLLQYCLSCLVQHKV